MSGIYIQTEDGLVPAATVPGQRGLQGFKGDKGDQGIQGLKGDQGIQGLKGDQGIQGLKGDQGIQGLKGDQGIQGIQGLSGLSVVNHGTDANVARPNYPLVYWRGTARPVNALATDFWYNA